MTVSFLDTGEKEKRYEMNDKMELTDYTNKPHRVIWSVVWLVLVLATC